MAIEVVSTASGESHKERATCSTFPGRPFNGCGVRKKVRSSLLLAPRCRRSGRRCYGEGSEIASRPLVLPLRCMERDVPNPARRLAGVPGGVALTTLTIIDIVNCLLKHLNHLLDYLKHRSLPSSHYLKTSNIYELKHREGPHP